VREHGPLVMGGLGGVQGSFLFRQRGAVLKPGGQGS
jgi:hypothetical protein